MSEKWKNIITLSLLSAFLLGFGAWAAAKPADELSLSERRPLGAAAGAVRQLRSLRQIHVWL